MRPTEIVHCDWTGFVGFQVLDGLPQSEMFVQVKFSNNSYDRSHRTIPNSNKI